LLAFIGGVSAASAMMIVTTLALAHMCLNHLLLPARYPQTGSNIYKWLLWGRRTLICVVIFAGFGFYLALQRNQGLVQLGLISFVARSSYSIADTRAVRGIFIKTGLYPANPNDGTLASTSNSSMGNDTVTGLDDKVLYYFAAFVLDQAGNAGCDIVCLGEGWATLNTGIGWQKDAANQVPGTASNAVAAKADQHNMYVVAGFYDWNGDTLYNVAVLFDRDGNQAGYYKKVHLPNSEVEGGIVPGNEYPVFQTDFGTIGMQVCWDYDFPEGCRILALKGAEMIFCEIIIYFVMHVSNQSLMKEIS